MTCQKSSICESYSEISYTCNEAKKWERDYCGVYKNAGKKEEGFISKIIENFIVGLERFCGGHSLDGE